MKIKLGVKDMLTISCLLFEHGKYLSYYLSRFADEIIVNDGL